MYAALQEVLKQMASWDAKKVLVVPQKFVQTLRTNAVKLGRPDFAGWQQNDVAELYTIIGECVHEATRKKATVSVNIQNSSQVTPIDEQSLKVLSTYLENQYSLAAKALAGVESSVITDSVGEYISCRSEVFYTMAVPVPATAGTVQDCVTAHSATVRLTGDNKYAMPDNSDTPGALVDANQNHIVWLAPQFLVIETRLYRFDERTKQVFKGSEKLAASAVLELETWSSNKKTKVKYLLCGVAYHRGGNSQGGHYTAVVRNKEGELWNCNDTQTAPLARGQGWPVGGYCFFYRKIL
jgi:ubiquitin C-terminal hydrolase